jgi:hypothetical protein
MKTSINKLLAVFSLLFGLGAVTYIESAKAEPTCPGSGAICARNTDGTTYYKGTGY